MIPEREGERRYQADHVATAVMVDDVLVWFVRSITSGKAAYTKCLSHASHWRVTA
jgi:hypothetical protein